MHESPLSPEIITRYLSNRQKDLARLTNFVQNKNFYEIARHGHTIKGNAESFGFPELGEIAIRMEDAALAENMEQVLSSLRAMEIWMAQALHKNSL